MPLHTNKSLKTGFTIIEIAIVLVIIGVIFGIAAKMLSENRLLVSRSQATLYAEAVKLDIDAFIRSHNRLPSEAEFLRIANATTPNLTDNNNANDNGRWVYEPSDQLASSATACTADAGALTTIADGITAITATADGAGMNFERYLLVIEEAGVKKTVYSPEALGYIFAYRANSTESDPNANFLDTIVITTLAELRPSFNCSTSTSARIMTESLPIIDPNETYLAEILISPRHTLNANAIVQGGAICFECVNVNPNSIKIDNDTIDNITIDDVTIDDTFTCRAANDCHNEATATRGVTYNFDQFQGYTGTSIKIQSTGRVAGDNPILTGAATPASIQVFIASDNLSDNATFFDSRNFSLFTK